MKKLILIGIILSTSTLFFSCKKEAGKGGKASIKGTVVATYYCSETGESKTVSGANGERVYLSYGGGNSYDDDLRAGTNGEFEFKYLNPGNYRITVQSECDTCATGESEISTSIEIGKKDKNVSMGEIKIDLYNRDYCDGPGAGGVATVNGSLEAYFINGNNNDTLGVGPLFNERVYLVYGEGNTHSDDVRSSSDGSFQFTRLRPGKYRVYAYSDCIFCNNEIEASYLNFEIPSGTTSMDLSKLKVVIIK